MDVNDPSPEVPTHFVDIRNPSPEALTHFVDSKIAEDEDEDKKKREKDDQPVEDYSGRRNKYTHLALKCAVRDRHPDGVFLKAESSIAVLDSPAEYLRGGGGEHIVEAGGTGGEVRGFWVLI